ncbi:MAG: hypothetical protein ACREIT_02570 [Tepidisphaeraceae bacterium]
MPGDRSFSETQPPSAATPAWITPALIARTRRVWSPLYGHELTDDDAIELLISVGALCDVLFAPNPLDKSGPSDPPAIKSRRSA